MSRCEEPVLARMLYDDIYSTEVVMARVGHLDRDKRRDIERSTRIIRECLDGVGSGSPRIAQMN